MGEGIIKGAETIQRYIPEAQAQINTLQERDPIAVGILATAGSVYPIPDVFTPLILPVRLTDIITYTTFLYSHLRLTHPDTSSRPLLPFPISPHNSVAAVAHLVRVTGVKYLWVTEGPMRAVADEIMHQEGLENTVILPFPFFSDLYSESRSSVPTWKKESNNYVAASLDQPALILHSSGKLVFIVVSVFLD